MLHSAYIAAQLSLISCLTFCASVVYDSVTTVTDYVLDVIGMLTCILLVCSIVLLFCCSQMFTEICRRERKCLDVFSLIQSATICK